ncbi:hypothetical protein H1R20_g9516, partial [Candolleomyces eurysporus]
MHVLLGDCTLPLCNSPVRAEQAILQDEEGHEFGSQDERNSHNQDIRLFPSQDSQNSGEPLSRAQDSQDSIEFFSQTRDVRHYPRNQDEQGLGQPTMLFAMHHGSSGYHLPTTDRTDSFAIDDEDYPMHPPDTEGLQSVQPIADGECLLRPQPCDHLLMLQEVAQAIRALNEALDVASGRYNSRRSA